jgi:predicted MFS family arabinose efflux permease
MGFLNAGAWVVFSGNYLVVIVLAREQGARPAAIVLLRALGGVGGIAGGALAGWIQRRVSFSRVVIGGIWLWAVIWPLYALAPNLLAIGAVSACLFVVFPIYSIVQMSYRLALIPDRLQGRVNSAFRIIAFSGQPAGYALSGALLQSIGSRWTVVVLWVWLIGLAVAASCSKPVRNAAPIASLRSARPPDAMDRAARDA